MAESGAPTRRMREILASPRQVALAQRTLAQIIPFEEWLRAAPRTEADQEMYHTIRREFERMAAGPWVVGVEVVESEATRDDS